MYDRLCFLFIIICLMLAAHGGCFLHWRASGESKGVIGYYLFSNHMITKQTAVKEFPVILLFSLVLKGEDLLVI